MKISSGMKSFLVGFPLVLIVIATVCFLVANFGGGALVAIGLLGLLGVIGFLVGDGIREKFGIWK